MIGALLAIVGIAVIFGADLHQGFTFQGAVFAAIAGYGYGAFSVAMKQTGASGGLLFTRQLLFFGALYLPVPAAADGFAIGPLSLIAIASILALAMLPTILGFFCTTKAIEYLKPSQVQASNSQNRCSLLYSPLLHYTKFPSTASMPGRC
jgi:DME family drug/metabolite transporter